MRMSDKRKFYQSRRTVKKEIKKAPAPQPVPEPKPVVKSESPKPKQPSTEPIRPKRTEG